MTAELITTTIRGADDVLGKLSRETRKRETKRGEHSGEWARAQTPRPYPEGEAYAKSEWTLKTNEGPIAKYMPLLNEFPSYSEWGERSQKVGENTI